MGDFIANTYDYLFKNLYGQSLSDYLWGWECGTEAYTGSQLFNTYAIALFVCALILVVLYYYVWKPVRRQRLYWALLLVATGALNFYIAYHGVNSDYDNGLIGSCLLQDENGNALINGNDIVGFGMANGLLAILVFVLLSFILKWGSKTVRNYPV
jgi:hypothetical protein